MATQLDELSVKFSADISGLKTSLDKIELALLKVGASSDRTANKVGSLGRFLKFDVLMRYGQQLIRLSTQQEELAASIKDTADRANIGTEALQRLRKVAEANGTTAASLDTALIKLQKSIGEFQSGSAEKRDVFEALGLDKLLEKGASTEQIFFGLATAVSKLKSEQQAAAVVSKILGKEGDALVETLKQGGPAAAKMAAEMKNVIPDELIEKLDAADKKTKEFNAKLNSLGSIAAVVFVDVTNWAGDLAKALDEVLGITKRWADLMVWIKGQKFTMDLAGASGAPSGLVPLNGVPGVFGGRNLPPPGGGSWVTKPGSLSAFVRERGGAGFGDVTPDQSKIDSLFASGGGSKKISEAEKVAARYRDTIADLTFEIENLGRAEAEAALEQDYYNTLATVGVSAESDYGMALREVIEQLHSKKAAVDELAKSWEVEAANANRVLAEYNEEMRKQAEIWESIGERIEDSVVDAFLDIASGAATASEAVGRLIEEIGQLIAKALILKAIEGVTDSVFGGAGVVGGKALGGAVHAGNAYMVGESGPELFVPPASGNIVPNSRLGGGGSVINISSVVNVPGGTSRVEFQRMLNDRDRSLADAVLARVDDKVRRSNSYATRR